MLSCLCQTDTIKKDKPTFGCLFNAKQRQQRNNNRTHGNDILHTIFLLPSTCQPVLDVLYQPLVLFFVFLPVLDTEINLLFLGEPSIVRIDHNIGSIPVQNEVAFVFRHLSRNHRFAHRFGGVAL